MLTLLTLQAGRLWPVQSRAYSKVAAAISEVRKRSPPTCSTCNKQGHTRRSCPAKQSGWTPVTIEAAEPGSKEALPFRIIRSKFSNLPVYLDYRNGGTRILTKIRRIDGDVMAMERMLRKIIGDKKLMTRVDELTGSITLHGNYRDSVNEWLRSLGF
eukprot:Em0019g333a